MWVNTGNRMAIDIYWHNQDKTIMVQRFVGDWSPSDVYWMVDKCAKMMASVSHKVDFIVEYVDSSQSLTKLIASSNISLRRYIDKYTAPNAGIVVLVGANTLLKTTLKVSILRPKALVNSAFADSFEDALALIDAKRMEIL